MRMAEIIEIVRKFSDYISIDKRTGYTQINQQTWILPSLDNSWVVYGGSYQNFGYMKDSLGFINVHFIIKDGSNGNIVVLPSGYRPTGNLLFPLVTAWNTDVPYVQIASTGQITVYNYTNTFCSFSFRFYVG
jgi:hypothetical protein